MYKKINTHDITRDLNRLLLKLADAPVSEELLDQQDEVETKFIKKPVPLKNNLPIEQETDGHVLNKQFLVLTDDQRRIFVEFIRNYHSYQHKDKDLLRNIILLFVSALG